MNIETPPVIDVVVPVHDEEATLGACVRRLHDHLSTYIPYPFRITIADNASTDLTPAVATAASTSAPPPERTSPGWPGVRRALARGDLPVDAVARRLGRGGLDAGSAGRIGRFAGVGVLSTLVHLGLFALLGVAGVGAQLANVLGLLAGTVVNTAANRRWTFGVRGRQQAVAHQMQGLAILGLTWLTSAVALWVTSIVAPGAPTIVQTVVVGVANAVATIVKYAIFRHTMRPADGFFVPEPDDSLCLPWTLASSAPVRAPAHDSVRRW